MSRVAARIKLSDTATQDAEADRAQADFSSDPFRYPCYLPSRTEAASFYAKVQSILDKENEITTLHECVLVLLFLFAGD
jgi:hypothetical protein